MNTYTHKYRTTSMPHYAFSAFGTPSGPDSSAVVTAPVEPEDDGYEDHPLYPLHWQTTPTREKFQTKKLHAAAPHANGGGKHGANRRSSEEDRPQKQHGSPKDRYDFALDATDTHGKVKTSRHGSAR
ncbi:hypothetical protein [Leeia oryzae]|uniref:hypothetical protein n=1 Tax=Leeia oryzae TaxID=356662 RepID=UPI000399AA6B|nr:hypothetical protein [Leeia oryzae]